MGVAILAVVRVPTDAAAAVSPGVPAAVGRIAVVVNKPAVLQVVPARSGQQGDVPIEAGRPVVRVVNRAASTAVWHLFRQAQ